MSTSKDAHKQRIIDAAATRWTEILQHVGGIPVDSLDGQHHPCPRCGGDDRFRLVDREAGAVLCNQCFNKKNGDGLAAVQWSLGIKFPEALKLVAEHLGIKPAKGKGKPKADVDIGKDLVFGEWSSPLAQFFLAKKPGVTEQSLLDAGARMARYKRQFAVIALPVIGETLDCEKPVGWVLLNAMGGTLPKWNQKGEVTGQVKVKLTYGSKPGLIGVSAIERMKIPGLVERVIKCEGVSDMLAVSAIIPANSKTVAITNANGAGEKPSWQAGFLAGFETIVLHDADEPGEVGVEVWGRAIASQGGTTSIARLPYEVEKIHGKDSRDWINEGHGWESLEKLLAAADPVAVKKDAAGNVVADEKADTHFERKICADLEIEVLGESATGQVKLFSMFHRKAVTIPDIGKLTYDRLVQICGPPAKAKVHKGAEDIEGMHKFSEVRVSIAAIAGYRRIADHDEVGTGVWLGRDLDENETGSIVLVNGSEAARYNGDRVLRKVVAPRVDGLLIDMKGGDAWYDFETLERHLIAVNEGPEFAAQAMSDSVELFSRWRWRSDTDPLLVTGLVLASWVQTVWRWRPQVSITGESNSGKSYLFEALGGREGDPGIFSTLAYKQAKSTEAGIRQGVGNTAMVIMCDEFERSRDRDKVLELIRTSSRGEKISRGTPGQKALVFGLQHICWVAATETGLIHQPDRNRFISLDLKKATADMAGKLVLPPARELQALGQRLLAVALHHALAARSLAVTLKDTKQAGVDPRQFESYAVPTAMLTLAGDLMLGGEVDLGRARTMLIDFVGSIEEGEEDETDHNSLLHDILMARVHTGPKDGVLTIGQIIDAGGQSSFYYDHAKTMEAQGLRLMEDGRLFVACRHVAASLLRGTNWEGQRIDKVLLRAEGSERAKRRVGGTALNGVILPIETGTLERTGTASGTDY